MFHQNRHDSDGSTNSRLTEKNMKTFLEFIEEDTSFAAGVPANSIGSGAAIQNIDPLLKTGKKKKPVVLSRKKPIE